MVPRSPREVTHIPVCHRVQSDDGVRLLSVERCCVDAGDHAQAAGRTRGAGRELCGRTVCRLCAARQHCCGRTEQASRTHDTRAPDIGQCHAENGQLHIVHSLWCSLFR